MCPLPSFSGSDSLSNSTYLGAAHLTAEGGRTGSQTRAWEASAWNPHVPFAPPGHWPQSWSQSWFSRWLWPPGRGSPVGVSADIQSSDSDLWPPASTSLWFRPRLLPLGVDAQPRSHPDFIYFLVSQHMGSWFPDPGSNLSPLAWTAREVPPGHILKLSDFHVYPLF